MPDRTMRMLRLARRAMLHGARWTGVCAAVGDSRWRQNRVLILAFHSLTLDEEHRWRRPLYFTLAEFRRRLRLLQRLRVNVLSLDDAMSRLEHGTLPPRSVVLTFDDGQVDFLQVAWPELERRGYPATVYATTYYGVKRLPIFPLMCSYVLWKARDRSLPAWPDVGIPRDVDLHDGVAREHAAEAIVARAMHDGLTAEQSNDRIAMIAGALGVDYATLMARRVLQVMSPEELSQVSARGADVQLHTHRHRTPRSYEAFAREIRENRAIVERQTARPAVHFCYPSGVYFPEFGPWLAELGVETGTTCEVALARRETPRLLLPRLIDSAEFSEAEVEGWITGVSEWLPRRHTRDAHLPTRADLAVAR